MLSKFSHQFSRKAQPHPATHDMARPNDSETEATTNGEATAEDLVADLQATGEPGNPLGNAEKAFEVDHDSE